MGVFFVNLKEALERAYFDKTQEQKRFMAENRGARSRYIRVQRESLGSLCDVAAALPEMTDSEALAWLNTLNGHCRCLVFDALQARREALLEECRDIQVVMVSIGRGLPR